MRLLLAFMLVLCSTFGGMIKAVSQTTDEKLSASEEREVWAVANKVSQQLRRKRDISLILSQPPASTVLDQIIPTVVNDVGLIKNEVALKATTLELRRFYIAMMNLGYLSDLFIYSKYTLEKTRIRDLPPEQQYPPNVVRFMKRDPLIAKWWKQPTPDESEKVVESVSQLRNLTATFQRASVLMQRYFATQPPEKTVMYRKNLLFLGDYLKEISVDTCDTKENCLGFPLHTRTVIVHLPVLQLVLIETRGQFKVLTLGMAGD